VPGRRSFGTILPLIERAGVATADEVDITTLQDRLASELMGANAVLAHRPSIAPGHALD